MFETLKGKLQTVFDGLAKRGALSEADVDAALREVRLALLDADVALPVVKSFIEKLRTEAVGVASLRSVRPDQQVIKIVHDALVEMLGGVEHTNFFEGRATEYSRASTTGSWDETFKEAFGA